MTFDPERILGVLDEHGVNHIVVGGIGGVLHGSPMPTNDVDIVPAVDKANLDALAGALNQTQAKILSHEAPEGMKVEWSGKDLRRWIVDFRFLNLTTEHGRLDLIYRPGGTRGYQDLAANAEELELEGMTVRVAALEDIIRSKQAVARDRDLEQLPTLRLLLESTKAAVRPGQEVIVPGELGEARGTVVEVRGVGPAARAKVRVEIADEGHEDREFPVAVVSPARP